MATRRSLRLIPLAALVLAMGAGCADDSRSMMGRDDAGSTTAPSGMGGSGMNGSGMNGSGMTGSGFGGSMMGSAPRGYHLSRLTCAAPASQPGSTVSVMVGDMGMTHMMGGVAPLSGRMMLRAVPGSVRAGQVSFAVANMGWRTHEMVVLPLAAGQIAGQRPADADGQVDEAGALGEASASCSAGTGEGIESGAVGWVTMDLPAGRYELICNLPNHYADGMFQELVVS